MTTSRPVHAGLAPRSGVVLDMHVTNRRNARILVLALAAATSLGACSKREAPEAARDMPALAQSESKPEARTDDIALEEAAATERKVIRTARMELRATDPAAVAAVATRLTADAGGFVASSNAIGIGDDIERVDMRLRVPANRFELVLGDLRDDGEVLVEALQGQDVTDEYIDLDARLRSQKALEDRLLGILASTTLVKDLLDVEAKLVDVRTEIERVEGRLRAMNDRVSFATIELAVLAPVRNNAREAETTRSRFDRALDDAADASLTVFTGMIRFMGVLLPFALLGAPIAFGVQAVTRRRRNRRS